MAELTDDVEYENGKARWVLANVRDRLMAMTLDRHQQEALFPKGVDIIVEIYSEFPMFAKWLQRTCPSLITSDIHGSLTCLVEIIQDGLSASRDKSETLEGYFFSENVRNLASNLVCKFGWKNDVENWRFEKHSF